MSDASITAISVALVAFFACVPPSMLAWAALRSSRTNAAKADVIVAKVDEVHAVTNSNLTKANDALAAAMEKIIGLEKLITALGKKGRKSEK